MMDVLFIYQRKSIDWFLYYRGLRHEGVKAPKKHLRVLFDLKKRRVEMFILPTRKKNNVRQIFIPTILAKTNDWKKSKGVFRRRRDERNTKVVCLQLLVVLIAGNFQNEERHNFVFIWYRHLMAEISQIDF